MVVRGGLPNDRCGQLAAPSRLPRCRPVQPRVSATARSSSASRSGRAPRGGCPRFWLPVRWVPRVAHGPPNRLVALGCRDPLAARKARRAALVVLAPLSGEATASYAVRIVSNTSPAVSGPSEPVSSPAGRGGLGRGERAVASTRAAARWRLLQSGASNATVRVSEA